MAKGKAVDPGKLLKGIQECEKHVSKMEAIVTSCKAKLKDANADYEDAVKKLRAAINDSALPLLQGGKPD